jgi:hypothetical protein
MYIPIDAPRKALTISIVCIADPCTASPTLGGTLFTQPDTHPLHAVEMAKWQRPIIWVTPSGRPQHPFVTVNQLQVQEPSVYLTAFECRRLKSGDTSALVLGDLYLIGYEPEKPPQFWRALEELEKPLPPPLPRTRCLAYTMNQILDYARGLGGFKAQETGENPDPTQIAKRAVANLVLAELLFTSHVPQDMARWINPDTTLLRPEELEQTLKTLPDDFTETIKALPAELRLKDEERQLIHENLALLLAAILSS